MASSAHRTTNSGSMNGHGSGSLSGGDGGNAGGPSYFETQRAELVREIAFSLEQVLQNLNRLNRGLEGIIAVGNEFSSVEALWSQFENVMGKDAEGDREGGDAETGGEKEGGATGREEAENAKGGSRQTDDDEGDEDDDTVVR